MGNNKLQKIGELNFGEFKTEIKATPRVVEYIKKGGLSLVTLIPEPWLFYEVLLLDKIDTNRDGNPNKEFGKKFIIIYNGIVEEGKWSTEEGLKNHGFKEDIKIKKDILFYSGQSLKSIKGPDNKKFIANYFVIKQ